MSSFNTVFNRVIGHEGGFQNDPEDRANWTSGVIGKGVLKGTKFGISAMSYPKLDIENLTLEQAESIYYTDWWAPMQLDSMLPAIQYQLFDTAINHGMRTASKMLQRAVQVKDDGVIGPKTIAAVTGCDHNDVLLRFLAERLEFFTKIGSWERYGRGWSMRVAQNLRFAADDN